MKKIIVISIFMIIMMFGFVNGVNAELSIDRFWQEGSEAFAKITFKNDTGVVVYKVNFTCKALDENERVIGIGRSPRHTMFEDSPLYTGYSETLEIRMPLNGSMMQKVSCYCNILGNQKPKIFTLKEVTFKYNLKRSGK